MPGISKSLAADLIETHRDELLHFLYRRTDCRETALDIIQDCFIKLAHYLENNTLHNPRAFIYRVAANLAIDYARQQQRTVALDDNEAQLLVDESAVPEQTVFDREQIELCEQALAELPPLTLKILVMSRFEGYTHKQIAAQLGISVSWVEKNIITALKHCKRSLRRTHV